MRFIDEASIRVAAGKGGPGCVSFRREKFVPRGGPDGGDGGDGGDVNFVASTQLSTLQDFRFKRVYQAQNGSGGSGANKAGKDGEDVQIRVPVGTLIKNTHTGEILVDFTEEGQSWTACHGGRGGKGNAHFVSSTFQAPKFAQSGEEGESRELTLELKLLADAAIIGFPNAGKSTLISRISAARPKIADYPFTTLVPNLGMVRYQEGKSFVVADIPGLIEGAHQGKGLGIQFLRHIERTRVLVVLLEATSPDPQGDFTTLMNELTSYSPSLGKKRKIVAVSKMDLIPPEEQKPFAKLKFGRGVKVIPISSVARLGLSDLLDAIWKLVSRS